MTLADLLLPPPQALAEKEGEGMAKMIYNKASGEILGVHIIGLHAADLIHEASNAIATGQTVQDIKFNVHAHPTLSEVGGQACCSACPGYCLRWSDQAARERPACCCGLCETSTASDSLYMHCQGAAAGCLGQRR